MTLANRVLDRFTGTEHVASRVASRFISAMEHPNAKARAQYLKEHPNADPKNHTVGKGEGGESRGMKPKTERAYETLDNLADSLEKGREVSPKSLKNFTKEVENSNPSPRAQKLLDEVKKSLSKRNRSDKDNDKLINDIDELRNSLRSKG